MTLSRRKLLRKGAQAIAAGGTALAVVPALGTRASCREKEATGVDYYQKLGVRPLINAAGTYTVLLASTKPDEDQAAVALAAQKAVNLTEILHAPREYISQSNCTAKLLWSRPVPPPPWWLARQLASLWGTSRPF